MRERVCVWERKRSETCEGQNSLTINDVSRNQEEEEEEEGDDDEDEEEEDDDEGTTNVPAP